MKVGLNEKVELTEKHPFLRDLLKISPLIETYFSTEVMTTEILTKPFKSVIRGDKKDPIEFDIDDVYVFDGFTLIKLHSICNKTFLPEEGNEPIEEQVAKVTLAQSIHKGDKWVVINRRKKTDKRHVEKITLIRINPELVEQVINGQYRRSSDTTEMLANIDDNFFGMK